MPPLLKVPAAPLTLQIRVWPGVRFSRAQLLEFANIEGGTLNTSTPPAPLPLTFTPLHKALTLPVGSSCIVDLHGNLT